MYFNIKIWIFLYFISSHRRKRFKYSIVNKKLVIIYCLNLVVESSYVDSTRPENASRPTTSSSSDSRQSSAPSEIFRCGTTSVMSNNRMSLKRRTDYGNAIRKYMARPKSAQEFFGMAGVITSFSVEKLEIIVEGVWLYNLRCWFGIRICNDI